MLVIRYKSLYGLFLLSLLFFGCHEADTPNTPDIVVTTYAPTNVGIYYATCGGDVVTNIHGLTLSGIGVCWSETQSPTIHDEYSMTDRVSECFVYTIDDLKPNTKYFVRAFALRGTQPYYGEEMQFQTLGYDGINVITNEVKVSSSSVIVSGSVVSDGGVSVEKRGFCWSTSSLPTISDNYYQSGSGLGEFRSTISGLSPETTYYIRAYAMNLCGVYYGQVLSFTTGAALPISIDGVFSDWDKVDASKMAIAQCDPLSKRTALKLVKVCADWEYVFVYFEWDKNQITHQPDVEHVPFHCFINTDGNKATGGYADRFSDACTDLLLEGFIYPEGYTVGSYEPGVYEWIGETNGTGWDWNDLGYFNNLTAGAGIEGKYELRIVRARLPKKLNDTFSIGFDIEQSWDPVGILPNSHVTDDNPGGLAPSLQVKTIY